MAQTPPPWTWTLWDGFGGDTQSERQCSVSSQSHPEHCPPLQQSWGSLLATFGSSAMRHPTISAALERCLAGRRRHEAGGRGQEGPPCKTKVGLGHPRAPPHPSLGPVATGRYWTCRQLGGMRGSGRLPGLPPLPSGSCRPLPCPRWDAGRLPSSPSSSPGLTSP